MAKKKSGNRPADKNARQSANPSEQGRPRKRRSQAGTGGSRPPSESAQAESNKPPSRRRRRGRRRKKAPAAEATEQAPTQAQEQAAAQGEAQPAPEEPKRPTKKRKPRHDRAEKPEARPREAPPAPRHPSGFDDLDLSAPMLEALDLAGYTQPTPVQAGLIPRVMQGHDAIGQAQTGTGKTAAFAIPILERLEPHSQPCRPQALVLAPTRELAVQVRDEFVKLVAGRTTSVVAVYGGKPIRGQMDKLRRGADVVVGTPGRILDHLSRRTLFFDDVRYVVLDEADRMLDIGFRPDIEKILRRCPQSRQTMLLSATVPPAVMRLAERYMRDPESLDFSPKRIDVETIEQFYFTVDPERKFDLLYHLLEREEPAQAIIFCRTKRGTDKVYRRLKRKIPTVDCIHGDLPQGSRDRVMERFRRGDVKYLVATDVVGRGIDVTTISHIINYDIPEFCDDYVHRVGRTGRMGREGVAFTFVTPEEGPQLTRIEMRINRQLHRQEIPDFPTFVKPEKVAKEPPKPVFGRRQRRHRRAL